MGMLPSHVVLLAKESKKHPIKGSVLTLGQQSVYLSLAEVKEILESQDISLSLLKDGFDVQSKVNKGQAIWDNRTNAQTVLSLLGGEEVFVSDCSAYEDPDFLIDLNYPVNDEYFEKFDVILDIGTLEHVFNIPMLLRNLNFMLKKGGQVIMIAPTSNSIDHGFYSISPTLFFDSFSVNNFNNFSCYLSEADPKMLFLGFPPTKSKIYQYHYVGPQFCLTSKHTIETIFFATKSISGNSVEFKIPSQSIYSNDINWSVEQTGKALASHAEVKIFSKSKCFFKKLYKKFSYILPARLLMIINISRYNILKHIIKSPNLTFLGKIYCSSNFKTFNCSTTVKFKK